MQVFFHREVVPPGGRYFYEVPETKTYLEGLTFAGFIAQVRQHYVVNGIPVPLDLAGAIQDFMCRRLPRGFCQGAPGEPEAGVRVFTLPEIRARTQEAFRLSRNQMVSPGEAERRTEACLLCRSNDRSLCPSCVGLVAWARKLVGGRRVSEWLGICSVDGIASPARVHFARAVKEAGGEYPEKCWLDER